MCLPNRKLPQVISKFLCKLLLAHYALALETVPQSDERCESVEEADADLHVANAEVEPLVPARDDCVRVRFRLKADPVPQRRESSRVPQMSILQKKKRKKT